MSKILLPRWFTTLTGGISSGNPWIGDAINTTEIWGRNSHSSTMMRAIPRYKLLQLEIYDNGG